MGAHIERSNISLLFYGNLILTSFTFRNIHHSIPFQHFNPLCVLIAGGFFTYINKYSRIWVIVRNYFCIFYTFSFIQQPLLPIYENFLNPFLLLHARLYRHFLRHFLRHYSPSASLAHRSSKSGCSLRNRLNALWISQFRFKPSAWHLGFSSL